MNTAPPAHRIPRSVWVAGGVVGAAIVVVAIVLVLQHRDSGGGAAASDSGRVPLAGFDETEVSVEAADPLTWCMLLASTQVQHARGLMQVTDPTLGGYDGMVFRFGDDTDATFYMRNTPMPLSIAFITADGTVVTTTDMAPCEDRTGCPVYASAAPYRTAIEVPQGQLARLGIAKGTKVTDTQHGC